MAISWADAVAAAHKPDGVAVYQRALDQLAELEPLVRSFATAVDDAGHWPTWDGSQTVLSTAPFRGRQVQVAPGVVQVAPGVERWSIFRNTSNFPIVDVHDDGRVRFGFHLTERTQVIDSPDFYEWMNAIDEACEWVPQELVWFLRRHDIPVPE